MIMRYASVCAGIEAASVAWEPLGWRPVLFSEIEAFPRAVLKHRQRAVEAYHAAVANTLKADGFDASEDGSGRTTLVPMLFFGDADPVATAIRMLESDPDADLDALVEALAAAGVSLHVRRLLPVECERLQGFPDGYTDIPWRGRAHSSDGSRYKALGNSMAVPVMRWLGERIEAVEAALAERSAP